MADNKKRLPFKRVFEYARDYTVLPDGEVEYHGPLYEFEDPEDCAPRFRRFAVESGIATSLMLLEGLLHVASMRFSAFVIFPYAIGLIAVFILLVSCLRLVRASAPMERRTFDTSFGRLPLVSGVLAIAAAVAFVGHWVFTLTHLQLFGLSLSDIVFGVAMGVVTTLSVLIFLTARKIRYRSHDA